MVMFIHEVAKYSKLHTRDNNLISGKAQYLTITAVTVTS